MGKERCVEDFSEGSVVDLVEQRDSHNVEEWQGVEKVKKKSVLTSQKAKMLSSP